MVQRPEGVERLVARRFSRRLSRVATGVAGWILAERDGLLVLALVLGAAALFRWTLFRPNVAPPGSDGGQWLAFGHQLLSAERIKAGFESYPPLVPFIVGMLAKVLPPLITLKLVGVASVSLVAVAMYPLVRVWLGFRMSGIIAGALAFAPYQSEILMFGGYPQLAGTGLSVFALFILALALDRRRPGLFILAGVIAAATVATHLLAAIQLGVAMPVVLALHIWSLRRDRGAMTGALRQFLVRTVVPAVLLSLPVLPSYSEYLAGAHVDSANPAVRSVPDLTRWLSSSWGWEFVLWAAVGVVSLPFVIREVLAGNRTMASIPVALYVAAGVGVVGLSELRFVNAFEPAVACAAAIAVSRIPELLGDRIEGRRIRGRRLASGTAVACGLAFVLWLSIVGVKRSVIAYDWYSVVSNDVLDGVEWLRLQEADAGSVVVASAAPRGNIYGWWIEGLAHLPTYSAGSADLFVDRRERLQVETAVRLLDPSTPLSEARSIADAEGVRYAFVDKGVHGRTVAALARVGFVTGFENSQVAVLKRIGNR